jgi:cytoskeletal protein CcmA (bactofilin family)
MWGSKRNERAPLDDPFDDRDELAPQVETPAAAASPPSVRTESPPVVHPQPKPPEVTVSVGSVLGRTLHFRGDLAADEDLVLQGRVEGSITHTGCLTIGADGTTVGNVSARQIIVEGNVEGDVTAAGSVSVRASGAVHGSIIAPRVAIADGARFNGSIDMDSAQVEESATPARSGRNRTTDDYAGEKQASHTAG